MIEYINRRMNEWAAWCKRRDDGGLGYAMQSIYSAEMRIHGASSSGAITQFAAQEEIEAVMVRIRKASPDLWAVADWFYLKGSFTKKRIAQELRCDESTVFRRLHALHIAVMDGIHELELEAQDRYDAWHAAGAIASAVKDRVNPGVVVVRRKADRAVEYA